MKQQWWQHHRRCVKAMARAGTLVQVTGRTERLKPDLMRAVGVQQG